MQHFRWRDQTLFSCFPNLNLAWCVALVSLTGFPRRLRTLHVEVLIYSTPFYVGSSKVAGARHYCKYTCWPLSPETRWQCRVISSCYITRSWPKCSRWHDDISQWHCCSYRPLTMLFITKFDQVWPFLLPFTVDFARQPKCHRICWSHFSEIDS